MMNQRRRWMVVLVGGGRRWLDGAALGRLVRIGWRKVWWRMRVAIGRRRVVFFRQVVVFTSLPSHRGGVVRVLGRGYVVCGTGAVMRGRFEIHVEDTCGVEDWRHQGIVCSVRRVLDHELVLRVDNPAKLAEERANYRSGVAGAGTYWGEDSAVEELLALTW